MFQPRAKIVSWSLVVVTQYMGSTVQAPLDECSMDKWIGKMLALQGIMGTSKVHLGLSSTLVTSKELVETLFDVIHSVPTWRYNLPFLTTLGL